MTECKHCFCHKLNVQVTYSSDGPVERCEALHCCRCPVWRFDIDVAEASESTFEIEIIPTEDEYDSGL